MAILSASELLDAVAAKNDLSSSDYNTTQESQIKVWALDCLKWLLPMAPEYAIESVLQPTSSAGTTLARPSDCLKLVRVSTSNGDLCEFVPPHKYTRIANAYASGTNSYGDGFRIWTDDMGTVKVFRLGSGTLTAHYIKAPSWGDALEVKHDIPDDGTTWTYYKLLRNHTSAGDNGVDEPGVGANWTTFWTQLATSTTTTDWITSGDYTSAVADSVTIPDGWEGLISSYCSIMAKMKDEEPAQAQAYWGVFMQELSRFQGFENIVKSVGG